MFNFDSAISSEKRDKITLYLLVTELTFIVSIGDSILFSSYQELLSGITLLVVYAICIIGLIWFLPWLVFVFVYQITTKLSYLLFRSLISRLPFFRSVRETSNEEFISFRSARRYASKSQNLHLMSQIAEEQEKKRKRNENQINVFLNYLLTFLILFASIGSNRNFLDFSCLKIYGTEGCYLHVVFTILLSIHFVIALILSGYADRFNNNFGGASDLSEDTRSELLEFVRSDSR